MSAGIVIGVIVTAVCVVAGIVGALAALGVWIEQCYLGKGASINVQVDYVQLLSPPTDTAPFGWEWMFGKPSDEIAVHLKSNVCYRSNKPRKIKEKETIEFGDSLSLNTFYSSGFSFWLVEADSGFNGKDDLSKKIFISSQKVDKMRQMFDSGAADYINLDYTVTVKGANIFQEIRFLGFLAENLCVNALDFVMGPWTSKAVGKAFLFKSSPMAKLYREVGEQYQRGVLTKKSLFKSVMTYQMKEGTKKALTKPLKQKAMTAITNWALNQTSLDEMLHETVTELTEKGVYAATGQEGLDTYRAVNDEIDKWAGHLTTLTDSLEFCLSEILPPSKDALYHVALTVRR